jgi:hypothetical protein
MMMIKEEEGEDVKMPPWKCAPPQARDFFTGAYSRPMFTILH